MGIAAPVAVGLGIMALIGTGRMALLFTAPVPFLPLLCGGADRGAITGKGQMIRNDQSPADRKVQELQVVKPENEGKRIVRF